MQTLTLTLDVWLDVFEDAVGVYGDLFLRKTKKCVFKNTHLRVDKGLIGILVKTHVKKQF